MKLILLLVSLGLATILSDNNTELLKTPSDRYHNFTSKIFNAAVLESSSNCAVCPTPLNLFLTIIYAGVKGDTAKNIINLLQIPESYEAIHETFSDLARKLNKEDYLNFGNINNKIYIQDGFQISNTYKRTLVDIFKSDIDNIDFKQSEEAVETVNSWIYEKSNTLIGEIISANDLNKMSTMLLVSTGNFRGLFTKNLFKEESTLKRDFYIGETNFVKTDMMEAFCNCSYYESKELDARFLKLNFTNIADGSITFILPNDIEGLNDLKHKMDQVSIKPNYSNQDVHIFIPTFKIDTATFDHSAFLDAGIGDAFENDANFTVIGANQEPLKISYINQKVIVEVNENGADITWTTHSMLESITPFIIENNVNPGSPGLGGFSSLDFDNYVQPKPKVFQAHHPFLYYITINDVNIGIGKFTKPEVQDVNQRYNVPVQSIEKIEDETILGNREQPIDAPLTDIVEEYTCPCNLN